MEENKQLDSKIRNEDKKAKGKFLLSMLLSLLLGGLVGGVGSYFIEQMRQSDMELPALLEQIKPTVSYISSYVLIAYTVIMILIIVVRIEKDLKVWKRIAEETEEIYEADYDKVDRRVSGDLLLINLLVIGSFLLFGLSVNNLRVLVLEHPALYVLALVTYMVSIIVQLLLQKKLINQYKKMNPEKQGSIYDTKFHKKWYESCDEAERALVGRAAKKAFEVINRMCLSLEVVLIFASMFFGIGIMAHIVVILIWAVGHIVYTLESISISSSI